VIFFSKNLRQGKTLLHNLLTILGYLQKEVSLIHVSFVPESSFPIEVIPRFARVGLSVDVLFVLDSVPFNVFCFEAGVGASESTGVKMFEREVFFHFVSFTKGVESKSCSMVSSSSSSVSELKSHLIKDDEWINLYSQSFENGILVIP